MYSEKFKNKTMIYLSPDADQELEEVNKECVYIVGGLADRTVCKNASLNRANLLNL